MEGTFCRYGQQGQCPGPHAITRTGVAGLSQVADSGSCRSIPRPERQTVIETSQWCHVAQDAGTWTVTLFGELDLLQAGELSATPTEAAGHDDTIRVCVDLAAVKFLDSTVIGALLQV
ncbi:hypothetical protein ACWT_0193 [Actinoplanes sp. SE50]|uniref:STAS domain-containing protein n=1 Tax=unclassified Actinoplanes TaxID=2626549 RepID=UPI00023ED6F0|nr:MULTISPECIES: STAS domain-containing protein [unclassified Actinoplanes]AEV81206.1 hypothetical protein ACPL_309 [Actinoplanes sp. SE50/110]ATO79608.1 hypothetical protein ACWT_0193 [Actinoplanes sp. SE50]SLL97011.1 anti-anti-sigma factor [Actinoplanes sp. SE50/110]